MAFVTTILASKCTTFLLQEIPIAASVDKRKKKNDKEKGECAGRGGGRISPSLAEFLVAALADLGDRVPLTPWGSLG